MQTSLDKAHAANKAFQRTPIRPSSAGKCARELYFELMQYAGKAQYDTEPMTATQDLLFGLGHHIESQLISKIRMHFKAAEVKYTQQSLHFANIEAVNDKRLSQMLEGSLDLCLFSDTFKCVADVKSKGDNWDFKARRTKWDVTSFKLRSMKTVEIISDIAFWVPELEPFLEELDDPFFEANFIQLNMYANSDFLKERGVDHAAIFQYQKNKSLLREVRFAPSAALFDKTIKKMQNIVRAVDENNIDLAPREYTPESFKSRYCDFCKAKVPGSCAMRSKEKENE
jgi:hypothetical protein